MRCDGCKFCCWSFAIHELPEKKELQNCCYECKLGCSRYDDLPKSCGEFTCSYLIGDPIHRPDTFQELLESLKGNIGNYIPAIPLTVPVVKANELIKSTRTILATILIGNIHQKVVLPLDRNTAGNWYTGDLLPWKELCAEYGVSLVSE